MRHSFITAGRQATMIVAMLAVLLPFYPERGINAAATRTVSTAGSDVGDCATAPCRTIGYALSQALDGNTISIESGAYQEHDLIVSKSIVMRAADIGGSVVIDAGRQGGIFIVPDRVTVQIQGLTMINGLAKAGGAISNQGTLTLTNSVIESNEAYNPINGFGYGDAGAIYNTGIATVTNSILTRNKANYGGAVFNSGTITLNNSVVSRNQADRGAGFYTTLFLRLNNSHVDDNLGTGVLCIGGTPTEDDITGGSISRNTDGGLGGFGCEDVITGTSFISNVGNGVTSEGGISLTNVTIDGTSEGRALVAYSYATMTGSTVSNNTGGGIENGGVFIVTNSTISGNNLTTVRKLSDTMGAAIYSNSRLSLTNTTVALNASGVYSYQSSQATPVRDTLFDNLSANCTGPLTSLDHNLSNDGTCYGLNQPHDLSNTDPRLGVLAANGGTTQTHGLLPGSPAIDAIPSAQCAVTTDQRALARPQGSGCDIGAFEASAALPPPRPSAPPSTNTPNPRPPIRPTAPAVLPGTPTPNPLPPSR